MAHSTTIQASAYLLKQLANPAARALLLASAAGLALTAFRVRATSVRLFTWTAVLYAALALPLLSWVLPQVPIPAPAFLQNVFSEQASPLASEEIQPADVRSECNDAEAGTAARGCPGEESSTLVFVGTAKSSGRHEQVASAQLSHGASGQASLPSRKNPEASSAISSVPLLPRSFESAPLAAAAIYLAVTLLLLVRILVGLVLNRRLMGASHPIDDPRITLRLAEFAHAAGMTSIPRAAESEFISVPVTMGALQSLILLPTSWREWDDAKLDAVVAHEASHVARRDALTQHLSLLHRAIFWFSPLAWWLHRQLAGLAEQAADEATLSCGADRKQYARILLGFFEALHAAPERVWWQGVSMAKAGQAEERLERILCWKGSVAMNLKKSVAAIVITCAMPVIYLAASVHPANARPQNTERPQTQAPQSAPAAAPAASPESASTPDSQAEPVAPPTGDMQTAPPSPGPGDGVAGGVAAGVPPVSPVAQVGPTAPVPTVAPVAPIAPIGRDRHSHNSHSQGYSYGYGYDDDMRFVIVTGKSDSLTMSGSGQDARHVEKLRKTIPGDFIWFQQDEKSYIIRDQATIDRAKKLWAPQEEIGKKQEELGKQQEALGKQQEELGAKMEHIRVNVPDMSAELDKLKAELKALSSGATVEQVGNLQSEIGELQSKIGEIQSKSGDQQGKLGEEMGALGEKQGKLGEEQGKLGEQQGKLAEEASHQMKQLLDEAIKNGTAQPEP